MYLGPGTEHKDLSAREGAPIRKRGHVHLLTALAVVGRQHPFGTLTPLVLKKMTAEGAS